MEGIPLDELHRAWLVVGLRWSILKIWQDNSHPIFRILKRYMTDKIQDTTGVNLEENTIQNEKEDR